MGHDAARSLQILGRACLIGGVAAFVGILGLVSLNRARPEYFWFFIPLPEPLGRLVWRVAPLVLSVSPICFLVGTLFLVQSRRLQAAARLAGKCAACGYDLRGNVSGTCPECGTPTGRQPGGTS